MGSEKVFIKLGFLDPDSLLYKSTIYILYLLNRCGIIKDPATKLPKIKVIETRS
jgi:hypothetical protein